MRFYKHAFTSCPPVQWEVPATWSELPETKALFQSSITFSPGPTLLPLLQWIHQCLSRHLQIRQTLNSAQCFHMTRPETNVRLQGQTALNIKSWDRQKVEDGWPWDGVIDGAVCRGGARELLTDERLRDHQALMQTEKDRSLPRKGQVY